MVDADSGADAAGVGGPEGAPDDGFGAVTEETTPAISLATDLPALATSVTTPTALFITFMVPAIAVADILPARRVSSTPSAKRLSGLGDVEGFGAYFDSRKSM